MNKIVREHYPVEKLPEDLRKDFPADALVTVRIVQEDELVFAPPARALDAREAAALIKQQQESAQRGRSLDDIVAEVRKLRDEWDE